MLLNCGVGEDFRVLWTARRSNQFILKEISPGCSLEGLMLKLKLQYFGHLMWSADSFEKILMLGKIEVRRRRGRQRMIWLDGITNSWPWVALGVGDGQGSLACCGSWCHKEWDTTEQLNWTELTRRTFVDKVMSLPFNMLSRLVITFLARSKHLSISWLQSPSAAILEPRKSQPLFPLIPHLFAMKWWDQMPWS